MASHLSLERLVGAISLASARCTRVLKRGATRSLLESGAKRARGWVVEVSKKKEWVVCSCDGVGSLDTQQGEEAPARDAGDEFIALLRDAGMTVDASRATARCVVETCNCSVSATDPVELDHCAPLVVVSRRRSGDLRAGDEVLGVDGTKVCLLYTSPSPRDRTRSRMPSSA